MEIPDVIGQLAEKLGTTASAVVSEYTSWFIVDGLVSFLIGAVMVILAFRWKPKKPDDHDEVILGMKYVAKFAMIFIGGLIIAGAAPNLLQPKAKAIHQLIRDVRG